MKIRLSVSLPLERVRFIERHKQASGIATSSEVVERALELLERQEFDMVTQMGNDAQLRETVEMSKEAAEDIFDDLKT